MQHIDTWQHGVACLHSGADLSPFGTFGTLHPFLESVSLLLLHGACKGLARERVIIVFFLTGLVCIPLVLILLLTAGA